MTGPPTTVPDEPGAWSGTAAQGGGGPLQCPRCQHSVRYKVCPYCRLCLYCRVCNVRLADPIRQAACDVCGAPNDQAVSSPLTASESTAAGPPPGLLSPADKVDELIESFQGAGVVRRQAADYAAALMANDRLMEAPAVLDAALTEPGDQPTDGYLLLLRGHCLQSTGRPGPALQDLLASVESDPGFLPSAAPGLQRLLLSAEAREARLRILGSWAPALESRVSPQDHLLLLGIELQAAVLQHDSDRAVDVVERARGAYGQSGTARCTEVLDRVRLRGATEGGLFEALARTEAALGMAEEAAADVNRAVGLGLGQPGADVSLLEFKAALLSDHGPQSQASALRQAGVGAYDQNDFANAANLLRRAWTAEADARTGWYLADAIRVLAANPTADQQALLQEALEIADRAAAFQPIEGQLSWGYSVLANIHLELANQEPLAGQDHCLRAALSAERRLLLDEDDKPTLTQLAQAYQGVSWHALSADAASKCRAALNDAPEVLAALGLAQLEVGAEEFRETFTALLRDPQVTDLLRGVLFFVLDRKDEALALLQKESDSPERGWQARAFYARFLLLLDREAEAEAEFKVIRERGGTVPEPLLSITERAFASYALGEYEEALDLLQPAIEAGDHSNHDPFQVYGTVMLCHLARGDVEQAITARTKLLALARSAYDSDDCLAGLARLGRRQNRPEVATQIKNSVEMIEAAAADIRRDGLDLDVALRRLEGMAVASGSDELSVTQQTVAAMASMRLLLERRHWEEAARVSTAVLACGGGDPACADAVVNRLFLAVDNLVQSGGGAVAVNLLGKARGAVGASRRREVAIRMVLVGVAFDGVEDIRQWSSDFQDSDGPTVAAILRSLASNDEMMYQIAARAQKVDVPGLDEALQSIAEEALGLNLEEEAGAMTAPILVEVGDGLVTVRPQQDGPLFQVQLPALRDRVGERTGVRLPAILVRLVPELPRTGFRVSVGGQWPESGTAEPGMVYVRRSSEEVVAALGGDCHVVATTDPLSGEASCWVTPPEEQSRFRDRLPAIWKGSRQKSAAGRRWKTLLEDTGTWDDPLAYPLAVLEHHVIGRLSSLVTADDIATTAERWGQGGGIDLDMQVVQSHLGRLTVLCRDLLDDGLALIPRPGSGADLERILGEAAAYPEALAAARDIFRTPLTEGGIG